jgi:hypothetical protein
LPAPATRVTRPRVRPDRLEKIAQVRRSPAAFLFLESGRG